VWCGSYKLDNSYPLSWTFSVKSSIIYLYISLGCLLPFDLVLSIRHIYIYIYIYVRCPVWSLLFSLPLPFCLSHLLSLFVPLHWINSIPGIFVYLLWHHKTWHVERWMECRSLNRYRAVPGTFGSPLVLSIHF